MNDKDINQKVKEAKKFRLHSILKLHTRILNQKLMNHAMGLQNVAEKLMLENKEVVFKHLIDLSLDFSVIGKHNFEVSEMANKLQLTSSQEELQALFKLVTKSDKEIRKELEEAAENEEDTEKCSCNCAENKAKNSKPNSSKVTTKVIEIVATSKEDALEQIKQILKEGKIK